MAVRVRAPRANPPSIFGFFNLAMLGLTGFGDWLYCVVYTEAILFGARIGAAPTFHHAMGAASFIYLGIIFFVFVPYMFIYPRHIKDGEGGTPALMQRLYEKYSFAKYPGVYLAITAIGTFSISLMILNSALTSGITQFGGYDAVSELPANTKYFWMLLPGATMVGLYMFVSNEIAQVKAGIIASALASGIAVYFFTHSEATSLVVFNVIIFFCLQRFRLTKISKALGPITLAFLIMITALSVPVLIKYPVALSFLNPFYAIPSAWDFLVDEFYAGGLGRILTILAALFLANTGGEAPFADNAVLGKSSIRIGSVLVTIPVLVCYAAQTALISFDPAAVGRSFYALVPPGFTGIVFYLSTLMANAACQALTTALFVMVAALVRDNFLPSNLEVIPRGHHDDFVPLVNWITMGVIIVMAVVFQSADRFAGVYGLTVSSVMLVSCLMVIAIMRLVKQMKWRYVIPMMIIVLVGNVVFVTANAIALDGAWIAPVVGIFLAGTMTMYHMRHVRLNPTKVVSMQEAD